MDIGVEILWIGPLFKSPMDDMGYDVENYRMIDPIFGTMDDFLELVNEMKKRSNDLIQLFIMKKNISLNPNSNFYYIFLDLKLITDLVPNHTSYKCEWFEKSVRREGKYTDYYMWKDAKNQDEVLEHSVTPIPPNNWVNIFLLTIRHFFV